ncbi:MAG: IgGFc-binding protein, partial [Candidatus Kapaibacterium sp.]
MRNFHTRLILLIIAAMSVVFVARANDDIVSLLPSFLGSNNTGTEFWFTVPPCLEDDEAGRENRIMIYVVSYASTEVTVRVPSKAYFETRTTRPWEVTVFEMTPAQAQPYEKSGHEPEVPESVYSGAGVQVVSKEPIAAFVAVRYRNSSDGFTLSPVSALGQQYIISSYPDMSAQYPMYHSFPSMAGIVAAYDNTKVTFTLGGAEGMTTAGGMTPGESAEMYLDRGDVWMFSSKGVDGDLSGSAVYATKPVAIVSGNQCANVPVLNKYCDYIAEMEVPTFSWGKYYHAPVFSERLKSPVFRIYAKLPATDIYKDHNQIAHIPEAGGVLGRAYIETRISDAPHPDPAVFHSDKPIFVSLYNTGTEEDGDPQPNGDPFQMALVSDAQFRKDVLFVTPGMMNGINYPENYLLLVYRKSGGNIPADLELGRFNGSDFDWTAVAALPGLTNMDFEYDVSGASYGLAKIKLAIEGTYRV